MSFASVVVVGGGYCLLSVMTDTGSKGGGNTSLTEIHLCGPGCFWSSIVFDCVVFSNIMHD